MDKIGLRQVLPDVFADNPPVGSEIWRRDVTFDKGRVYLVKRLRDRESRRFVAICTATGAIIRERFFSMTGIFAS